MEPMVTQLDWKQRYSEGEYSATADALFDAARVLAASDLFTERPVSGGCRVDPGNDGDRWRRLLISEMLFAFAVEASLKSFILADKPRPSRDIDKKIKEQWEIAYMKADRDLPEFYHLVESAESEEPLKTLYREIGEATERENNERKEALDPHGKHDLVALADAAKLQDIGNNEREYLRALSEAVVLGRYPEFRRPKQIRNLELVFSWIETKNAIENAIRKRFKQIAFAGYRARSG